MRIESVTIGERLLRLLGCSRIEQRRTGTDSLSWIDAGADIVEFRQTRQMVPPGSEYDRLCSRCLRRPMVQ